MRVILNGEHAYPRLIFYQIFCCKILFGHTVRGYLINVYVIELRTYRSGVQGGEGSFFIGCLFIMIEVNTAVSSAS